MNGVMLCHSGIINMQFYTPHQPVQASLKLIDMGNYMCLGFGTGTIFEVYHYSSSC